MNNQPIGIFDSGVGGLSILTSVKALLPNESFVYLADQKNNPYGGRSTEEIKKLAKKDVDFLVSKKAKLIIIACNTVSVNALDYLRSEFNIPIIAVVPVVKTIATHTKTGHVAVFSTPATAKSSYLKNLIKKFAEGVKVYSIGTSRLEHLVEEGIVDGPKIDEAIKNSLLPLVKKNVDSVALGCTHYPFLTNEIKKFVGSKIKIYDSGGAIARRTQYVLEHENLESDKNPSTSSGQEGQVYYYTTGDSKKFKKIAEELVGFELEHVAKIEL